MLLQFLLCSLLATSPAFAAPHEAVTKSDLELGVAANYPAPYASSERNGIVIGSRDVASNVVERDPDPVALPRPPPTEKNGIVIGSRDVASEVVKRDPDPIAMPRPPATPYRYPYPQDAGAGKRDAEPEAMPPPRPTEKHGIVIGSGDIASKVVKRDPDPIAMPRPPATPYRYPYRYHLTSEEDSSSSEEVAPEVAKRDANPEALPKPPVKPYRYPYRYHLTGDDSSAADAELSSPTDEPAADVAKVKRTQPRPSVDEDHLRHLYMPPETIIDQPSGFAATATGDIMKSAFPTATAGSEDHLRYLYMPPKTIIGHPPGAVVTPTPVSGNVMRREAEAMRKEEEPETYLYTAKRREPIATTAAVAEIGAAGCDVC